MVKEFSEAHLFPNVCATAEPQRARRRAPKREKGCETDDRRLGREA